MTCLSLFQVLLALRSSIQEMLLWGRPSLMSPLPAPDPASQQWPNLVWKRATMGEPTGPLISRSLPPTHPTGQIGSRTHTSTYTHMQRELPSSKKNTIEHKQMIAESLKELWQQPLSFYFQRPILNPPSPPLHTQKHTLTHLVETLHHSQSDPTSYPGSLLSVWARFSVSLRAPVVGVIHTPLPLALTPCRGWGEHTQTSAQTLNVTLRNTNIQKQRPCAKYDGLMWWIWAWRTHRFWRPEVEKRDFEYMWCKANVTFVIMSDLNSKCSPLREHAEKSVEMSNFCLNSSLHHLFLESKAATVCLKRPLIDL